MRHALRRLVVLALAVGAGAAACRAPASPIVVLISLDGWRWDYLDRFEAPRLRELAARGIRSEGLIPSFPSKTFPSHYSIVTGLYPEHHGIIANTMEDPAIGARFTLSSETVRDPRWWGGEPVWATASRQGVRSAAMFWPGSDVAIGGVRPDDWRLYDDDLPNAERVRQVLNWLARPEPERPAFVTLYFSDVDTAGHDFGPDSAELRLAAAELDRQVGTLMDGVRELGLADQTTWIIVSDHGMAEAGPDKVIFLEDYIELSALDVVDWGEVVPIVPRTATADAIVERLQGRHPEMAVYRRDATPLYLHYREHSRMAPVIAIAGDGWRITTRERFAARRRQPLGTHGHDPTLRSMHGLFIAAGPALQAGTVVPPFENVHLYAFMCRLLGIVPARHDGDPSVTAGLFKW